MNRRTFLGSTFAAALASALSAAAAPGRKPRILLRNAWQSMNIGDVAHWVGLFELMKRHEIDADVCFWASNLENGADALLAKYFPHVKVLNGSKQIDAAFDDCDFLLHGSSSGFAAWKHAAQWHDKTGKPFGVFGISITSTEPIIFETLGKAEFAFFRETVSLQTAKEHGCTCPIMEYGPDTAFGVVKTRNDEAATAFLKEHGLEEGRFLCCIPRYRWTPAWTVYKHREFDAAKHARNEEMKDHDHAPHREAIAAIVRETGMKVLVTHEDQTQIPLGKEMLVDPLPDDVKKHVVYRDRFRQLDEALAVYVRSAGLFGNEMHSPIMCVANGIPAVVCRFDEQTNKGFMWRDVGLDDWLFNLDKPEDVAKIAPTVLEIAENPEAAKTKAAAAREVVLKRQERMLGVLEEALGAVG
ncbi:MAG: polysaccharide pyruvyl transferase family protein [Planctomycetaceae bacterium]